MLFAITVRRHTSNSKRQRASMKFMSKSTSFSFRTSHLDSFDRTHGAEPVALERDPCISAVKYESQAYTTLGQKVSIWNEERSHSAQDRNTNSNLWIMDYSVWFHTNDGYWKWLAAFPLSPLPGDTHVKLQKLTATRNLLFLLPCLLETETHSHTDIQFI